MRLFVATLGSTSRNNADYSFPWNISHLLSLPHELRFQIRPKSRLKAQCGQCILLIHRRRQVMKNSTERNLWSKMGNILLSAWKIDAFGRLSREKVNQRRLGDVWTTSCFRDLHPFKHWNREVLCVSVLIRLQYPKFSADRANLSTKIRILSDSSGQ